MFSELERKATQEKFRQLKKVKEGTLSPKELAEIIAKRRVSWLEENREEMLQKYAGFPEEEKAWRIIWFDHMKINPEQVEMARIGKGKIRIRSKSFCSYLEACKELGLDTRKICKEVGEPAIQRMCEIVNPNLRFGRNYKKIRPNKQGFCEEYFELL